MEKDLDIAENKLNIMIESPVVSPDYNPFEEYFENLPKWDGKTNYIQQMARTVQTTQQKLFEEVFTKYLIGSLHCLLEENAVNDVCLVFQSAQGIGKTRWNRKLLPERFREEYLYEGSIDTKNKDHSQYLSQYWFIHLDELETSTNNEIGALKSFITQEKISLRKAYGRYKVSFKRRASFLGSVNLDKFLSDTTGNRRWLVFKLKSISYMHNIDVDKMWAQVYALWRAKTQHWFDHEEIKLINERNEEFRSMSAEEEMLLKTYEFTAADKTTDGIYLSATEVIIDIGADRPQLVSKLNTKIMGKALAKHVPLAKNRKISSGITKYYLKKIVQQTMESGADNTQSNQTYYNPQDADSDVPF